MIIRQWWADALPAGEVEYRPHFSEVVIPYLKAVPGFVDVNLARREMAGRIELLVITRWDSLDAVRRFAGPNISRAVVEDGAKVAVAFYDDHADVHEVVASAAV